MKKIILISAIIVLILSATGCGDGSGGGGVPLKTQKFWAMDNNDGKFYQLDAQLLAENARCEVWVELGSADQATAQSIANAYSGSIYNKMINTFSSNVIYNGRPFNNVMDFAHFFASNESSGKLTILLLDIKDNYVKGSNDSYVAGYFFWPDLYPQSIINGIDPSVKTNQRDMIYIDTNPGLGDIDHINEAYSTIAHEMQHLMNFMFSYLNRVSGNMVHAMDTWIDEGLSSAAEWAYGGHSDYKIDWYKKDQSGLIKKGNNFYAWGSRKNEHQYAVLDDYATVYLFFQWLRLQSNESIYKDIIKSPNENYQAVTTALNAKVPGQGYSSWDTTLGDWLAANCINAASGNYGYKNEPKLNTITINYAPTGNASITLYPGEGVYSHASSYTAPANAGDIKYLSLTSTGVTSGSFSGTLLTYNKNTTVNGPAVPGTITGSSVGIVKSVSGSGQGSKFSRPFPIGMGDVLRRNGHEIDLNKTGLIPLIETADE
jgi:hypothetical protein